LIHARKITKNVSLPNELTSEG